MKANSGMSTEVLDKIYADAVAARPPIPMPDGGIGVMVPEGYRLDHVRPLEPMLPRIRQRLMFHDLPSFTAYVNRFKSEESQIFAVPGYMASDGQAKLTAILDYHAKDAADHGAHVATYAPQYSEAWKRWVKGVAGRPMQQAAFGEFIEENRADVKQPLAAELIDLVNKFKATKKVDYNAVTNQPNGDVVIGYSEATEVVGNRQGVAVPTELVLGMAVFFKGPSYEVRMLMRYKLDRAELTFTIKPDRVELIEEHAFDEICNHVANATEITPYLGALA